MRLSNGFVIDKEKTFGELKFTAVRDVFLQNEDGTPSTQLKKRIYDLKCSLHGGIIPVCVPPEVPLREFPYNAVGIPYVCLKCFIKGMKQSISERSWFTPTTAIYICWRLLQTWNHRCRYVANPHAPR